MFLMKTMSVIITTIFLATLLCPKYTEATGYSELRLNAAKHNMTCILVFGDSSVDPGNNNHLSTSMKSNFLPYGEDFFNGHPSGRFCNGRLATDFIGARKLVVVGVPPFGCMPIVRTFRDDVKCDVELNKVAFAFNLKIQRELETLRGLHLKILFVDIYSPILNAIENPKKYGFMEPLKGCCGSGTYEYSVTCKNTSICSDRTKYIFWDAVHPTEKMYKLIADNTLEALSTYMFS